MLYFVQEKYKIIIQDVTPLCHFVVRVYLGFLSPAEHWGKLYPNMKFEIREGARIVGRGKITQILELEESANRAKKKMHNLSFERDAAKARRPSTLRWASRQTRETDSAFNTRGIDDENSDSSSSSSRAVRMRKHRSDESRQGYI